MGRSQLLPAGIGLLCGVLLFAPAVTTASDDLVDQLSGRWKMSFAYGGRRTPGYHLGIEGSKLTFYSGATASVRTFRLDVSKTPNAIDFYDVDGKIQSRGIFARDGDDVVLVFGTRVGDRPKSFTDGRGVVATWRLTRETEPDATTVPTTLPVTPRPAAVVDSATTAPAD